MAQRPPEQDDQQFDFIDILAFTIATFEILAPFLIIAFLVLGGLFAVLKLLVH